MANLTDIEANKKLVRDYTDIVFSGHQLDRAPEFLAPDVKWHGGTLGTVEGRDNVIAVVSGFVGALPDLKATEQHMVAEGDYVFAWLYVEATQKGELLGIPATGRRLRWDAPDLYHIVDGKIAEEWAGDDSLAILSGMGVYMAPWMQGR